MCRALCAGVPFQSAAKHGFQGGLQRFLDLPVVQPSVELRLADFSCTIEPAHPQATAMEQGCGQVSVRITLLIHLVENPRVMRSKLARSWNCSNGATLPCPSKRIHPRSSLSFWRCFSCFASSCCLRWSLGAHIQLHAAHGGCLNVMMKVTSSHKRLCTLVAVAYGVAMLAPFGKDE